MRVNVHHRRAAFVLGTTIVLDLALGVGYGSVNGIGIGHGIYCATGTATTVGCDIAPHGWLAYLLSTMMMVTIVPLFASVFAFFTTGLTADHIDKSGGSQ